MGGHGGLNILPQKRWNVYNFENREKVRKDEEAAAREEQLNREQSRRRDSEFRLERLRLARGLPSSLDTAPEPAPVTASASASAPVTASASASASASTQYVASDSGHINLFDGLQDFSALGGGGSGSGSAQVDGNKSSKRSRTEEADGGGSRSGKKWRKEEGPATTVTPEDEKYRLGYGLAGKGVKVPWYVSRAPSLLAEDAGGRGSSASADGPGKKNGGKKTIEELREERTRREKREKERERALFASAARKGEHRGLSRQRL